MGGRDEELGRKAHLERKVSVSTNSSPTSSFFCLFIVVVVVLLEQSFCSRMNSQPIRFCCFCCFCCFALPPIDLHSTLRCSPAVAALGVCEAAQGKRFLHVFDFGKSNSSMRHKEVKKEDSISWIHR